MRNLVSLCMNNSLCTYAEYKLAKLIHKHRSQGHKVSKYLIHINPKKLMKEIIPYEEAIVHLTDFTGARQ